MRKAILLILFLLITASLSAQKRRIPFYKFTQIDSLTNHAIHDIVQKDSSALVVASVEWSIGAYSHPKSKKDAPYSNPFDIYILFSKDNKYYIQIIDNFGYFVPKKINALTVQKYLTSYFYEMQLELIRPKSDTAYSSDGSILSISHFIVDHELSEQIKIYYNKKVLNYTFRASDGENSNNLLLHQYKFLTLIRELQNQLKANKPKRIKYLYKMADDEND